MNDQNFKKPKNYPAHTSGGLWGQEKTSPNQPDMKGSIEITQHQIQQLVQMGKMNMEPKLQIGAWTKQDSTGKTYISIDADVYVPQPQQGFAPNVSAIPPQAPMAPQAPMVPQAPMAPNRS